MYNYGIHVKTELEFEPEPPGLL